MNLDELSQTCAATTLSTFDIFNNFNSDSNIYAGIYGNAKNIYIKVTFKNNIHSDKIFFKDWTPIKTYTDQILSANYDGSSCKMKKMKFNYFY